MWKRIEKSRINRRVKLKSIIDEQWGSEKLLAFCFDIAFIHWTWQSELRWSSESSNVDASSALRFPSLMFHREYSWAQVFVPFNRAMWFYNCSNWIFHETRTKSSQHESLGEDGARMLPSERTRMIRFAFLLPTTARFRSCRNCSTFIRRRSERADSKTTPKTFSLSFRLEKENLFPPSSFNSSSPWKRRLCRQKSH